jgi:hypothetical protein
MGFSGYEFDSVFHVGVHPPNTSVNPLSLWERARVRVCFWLFNDVSNSQNLPTRFSGCPSDVGSLVFGCHRKPVIGRENPVRGFNQTSVAP